MLLLLILNKMTYLKNNCEKILKKIFYRYTPKWYEHENFPDEFKKGLYPTVKKITKKFL